MNRKVWTQEELEFIKNNYGKMTAQELADQLGRTESSVIHKLARHEIKSPREWSDDELQYIKDHYKDMTNNEISKVLGRTKTAVDLKINRLGLVKSKYHYNHAFFKDIQTEEQAYWCGFIMADECVTIKPEINSCELVIKLQADDGGHLKKFNKAIDGNVPVEYHDRVRTTPTNPIPRKYSESVIRLYSEEMVHDLEKYGVIPAKSLVKKFPDNIPEVLMNHYIRGYYDGNGSIFLSHGKYIGCSFTTGSYDFAVGLHNYLNTRMLKTSQIYNTHTDANCYSLRVSGMRNVDNFLSYLYHNSSVWLDRKFNKKNKLYSVTNMEQRLLRQPEMVG